MVGVCPGCRFSALFLASTMGNLLVAGVEGAVCSSKTSMLMMDSIFLCV